MVFHLEVFGNNDLFKQVSDIHLLEPYMYTGNQCSPQSIEGAQGGGPLGLRPVRPLLPVKTTEVNVGITTEDNKKEGVYESETQRASTLSTEGALRGTLVPRKKNIMPGIFPKKPDNLFWCVYIAFYGYDTYHEIGHRYGNIEMEEKQKMVELMKKSPSVAKQSSKKITKVLFQEIMSDFMTNKKMTMDMLTMMALYHNKHFMIAHLTDSYESEPYYITITGDQESTPLLLYKRGKYDYSFMLEPEPSMLEDIVNTRFKYENHDMPLKSVSNYKTSDLEHIFDVLEIEKEEGKKYKKEDYYKGIMLRCGFV